MKAHIYFKGSVVPDLTFEYLNTATALMESDKLTGIVVLVRGPDEWRMAPEVIWYNQGKRR